MDLSFVVVISFALLNIITLINNVMLRGKLEELEDENEELYQAGMKYRALYNRECTLSTFAEPLEK